MEKRTSRWIQWTEAYRAKILTAESTWLVYVLMTQFFESFHKKILEKHIKTVSILLDLSEPLINILYTFIRRDYTCHLHNFLLFITY